MPELIAVEVAYATPFQQRIVAVDVPENTTLETAIKLSGLLACFPEINLSATAVGIFGKLSELNQVLKAGDRVEIYRPFECFADRAAGPLGYFAIARERELHSHRFGWDAKGSVFARRALHHVARRDRMGGNGLRWLEQPRGRGREAHPNFV